VAHSKAAWKQQVADMSGGIDHRSIELGAADRYGGDVRTGWDPRLHSLVELCGPAIVYDVGLMVLEYPPTWVDTNEEAAVVEAAVIGYLQEIDNAGIRFG
jgi:hypothetical protein